MPNGDTRHDGECFTSFCLSISLPTHTVKVLWLSLHIYGNQSPLFHTYSVSLLVSEWDSWSNACPFPGLRVNTKGARKSWGGKKCKKEEEKTKIKNQRQLQPFQENAVWGHVIEAQCLLLTLRSSSLLHFRAAVTLSLHYSFLNKQNKPSPTRYTQCWIETSRLCINQK